MFHHVYERITLDKVLLPKPGPTWSTYLATQEPEAGRSQVGGQSGKLSETLSQDKRAVDLTQW